MPPPSASRGHAAEADGGGGLVAALVDQVEEVLGPALGADWRGSGPSQLGEEDAGGPLVGGEEAVQRIKGAANALAPGGTEVEAGKEIVHSGFHRDPGASPSRPPSIARRWRSVGLGTAGVRQDAAEAASAACSRADFAHFAASSSPR